MSQSKWKSRSLHRNMEMSPNVGPRNKVNEHIHAEKG